MLGHRVTEGDRNDHRHGCRDVPKGIHHIIHLVSEAYREETDHFRSGMR